MVDFDRSEAVRRRRKKGNVSPYVEDRRALPTPRGSVHDMMGLPQQRPVAPDVSAVSDFSAIANAYREAVQGGGDAAPRTGSGELESARALAKNKLGSVASILGAGTSALANYLAMRDGGKQKSGGGFTHTATTSPKGREGIQKLARMLAEGRGWDGDQWNALHQLIMKESGYNPTAQNPTSTAYGIGQFLDSTWGPYGPKTSDPQKQLDYMYRYIQNRYGDPMKALQFHLKNNWY